MIAHQHTPEASNVNLTQVRAQVRGGRLLAKCQECGGMIHKPFFQPDAEWRDVVIKERYALQNSAEPSARFIEWEASDEN